MIDVLNRPRWGDAPPGLCLCNLDGPLGSDMQRGTIEERSGGWLPITREG